MLDIETRHLVLVREILQRHAPRARAYAFGSRTSGRARPFSDLDIALDAGTHLDLSILGALRDDFSESNLPMSVDVIDLHSISSEFKQAISSELTPLV